MDAIVSSRCRSSGIYGGHLCPVLSSFPTYYRVYIKSKLKGVTGEAGAVYPSGASELTSFIFVRLRFAQTLVFCVVFTTSIIVRLFFFWPLYCLYFFKLRLLIYTYDILNFFYNVHENVNKT